jgi:hypothetical protein
VTVRGAGFDAGMRVFFGDGRAPVLFIDGGHALAQLPPGPLGSTNVRVTVGTASATVHGAFSYVSGGLDPPWQQKPLQVVRGEDPAVAVMQDGRVLIAGGTTVPDSIKDALDTAEVYSREADAVAPAANAMSTPRWQDAAVTLLDGRVLVVGGACFYDLSMCNGDGTLADLFDPTTNRFSPTGPLTMPRSYTRAVLLPDGRVLVASANDPSVDVYDPASGTFKRIAHSQPHIFGLLVRLRDGRALLMGGDGGVKAAEVFDPDSNTFNSVGPLKQARSMATAHTLPDGRVLVIGGADQSAGGVHLPLDTMEAFDPRSGTFTTLPYRLRVTRAWQASALVRDGTVLVMGGYTVDGRCDSLTDAVDQVDPVAGMVMPFPNLLNKNTEWNATTLLDGSVLGVGGGACGTNMALPDLDFLSGGPG